MNSPDANSAANEIAEDAEAGIDVSARAKDLLSSLRWCEDMVITNYEGERVWLKPALDRNGKRHGITDCCLADDPCDYHKALEGAVQIKV